MRKRTVDEYFDKKKSERVCFDLGVHPDIMKAIFSKEGILFGQLPQIDYRLLLLEYSRDADNLARIILKKLFPKDHVLVVDSDLQIDMQATIRAIGLACEGERFPGLLPGYHYEAVADPPPFSDVRSISVYVDLIRKDIRKVTKISKALNFDFSSLGDRKISFRDKVWTLVAYFETSNRLAELQAKAI